MFQFSHIAKLPRSYSVHFSVDETQFKAQQTNKSGGSKAELQIRVVGSQKRIGCH